MEVLADDIRTVHLSRSGEDPTPEAKKKADHIIKKGQWGAILADPLALEAMVALINTSGFFIASS